MIEGKHRVFVLDNTVFNIFARITSFDFIRYLNMLSNQILVPEHVFGELVQFKDKENNITIKEQTEKYISWITEQQYRLELCSTRDEVVFQQIKKLNHIDSGEADAVAQISKKMNDAKNTKYYIFCSDDRKCIEALEKHSYNHIKCISSLCLIFLFDIQKHIDYHAVMSEYIAHKKFAKKSKAKEIKEQYSEAAMFYGIHLDKKTIQYKIAVVKSKK